jgi:hypothetical protein
MFDGTRARGAGLAARHVVGSGQDAYYAWTSAFGQRTLWYGRVYVWFDNAPTGDVRLVRVLDDGAVGLTIEVTSSGALRLRDGAFTVIGTTPASIGTRRWTRIEWKIDHANGVVEVKIFNKAKGTAPTATLTTASGQTIGAATDEVDFGSSGTLGLGTTFWTDDAAAGWAAYLGPAA